MCWGSWDPHGFLEVLEKNQEFNLQIFVLNLSDYVSGDHERFIIVPVKTDTFAQFAKKDPYV